MTTDRAWDGALAPELETIAAAAHDRAQGAGRPGPIRYRAGRTPRRRGRQRRDRRAARASARSPCHLRCAERPRLRLRSLA